MTAVTSVIATRVRCAAKASLALLCLELGAAMLVSALIATRLAGATGAWVDPLRLAPALTELDAKARHQLLAPALWVLGALAAAALVEPFLRIAWTRAHALAMETPSPTLAPLWKSALSLCGIRALGVVAAGVWVGIVAGLGTFFHLASRDASDPRIHDVPLALGGVIAVAGLALAYTTIDLASVHVSFGRPRPLESLLEGARALAPRLVAARMVVGTLSVGVAAGTTWLAIAFEPTEPAVTLALMVAASTVRLAIGSAWLAYTTALFARGERGR